MFLFSPILLTSIIIVAVILLIVAIVLLYKFVIVRERNKRLQRTLSLKYSYFKSLLLGEDSQHIRRIESISNFNLLWKPKFQEFYKRFEELRDVDDRRASRAIQQINESFAKNSKEFKTTFNNNKSIIYNYEMKVTALNQDLLNEIKPETEIREEAVQDKEKYRIVKARYRESKKQLELVENQFDQIIQNIDNLFITFEETLSGAYFDEANQVALKIRQFIHQLDIALDKMPMLCVKTTMVLPTKIEQLSEKTKEVERLNVPIQHLFVKDAISNFNERIADIESRIKKFEIKHLDSELDKLDEEIDRLFTAFDSELEDKKVFEETFEQTYRNVNKVENHFISLKNKLPKLQEIYLFSREDLDRVEQIQQAITDLSNIKRTVDGFIHSSTKQPYSILTTKTNDLLIANNEVGQMIEDYFNFISTLRTDSEQAYNISREYFYYLKELEFNIRELSIPDFTNQFIPKINRMYVLINEILITVQNRPIKVMVVNKLKNELVHIHDEINVFFTKGVESARLAEETIVYLNRYRSEHSEVQQRLVDAEIRFNKGSFDDVYTDCFETLKKFKQ